MFEALPIPFKPTPAVFQFSTNPFGLTENPFFKPKKKKRKKRVPKKWS